MYCNMLGSWPLSLANHYNDVMMSAMASQITSLEIVYSTFYSGANQRNHQSSAARAFLRAKRASNAENVSIWWRHHVLTRWLSKVWASDSRRYIGCDTANSSIENGDRSPIVVGKIYVKFLLCSYSKPAKTQIWTLILRSNLICR